MKENNMINPSQIIIESETMEIITFDTKKIEDLNEPEIIVEIIGEVE